MRDFLDSLWPALSEPLDATDRKDPALRLAQLAKVERTYASRFGFLAMVTSIGGMVLVSSGVTGGIALCFAAFFVMLVGRSYSIKADVYTVVFDVMSDAILDNMTDRALEATRERLGNMTAAVNTSEGEPE